MRDPNQGLTPEQIATLFNRPTFYKKPRLRSVSTTRRKNIIKELMAADPFCAYCLKPIQADTVTLDHVHPRSKGGSNRINNIVLACSKCNSLKANRVLSEEEKNACQARMKAKRLK